MYRNRLVDRRMKAHEWEKTHTKWKDKTANDLIHSVINHREYTQKFVQKREIRNSVMNAQFVSTFIQMDWNTVCIVHNTERDTLPKNFLEQHEYANCVDLFAKLE